MTRPFRAYVGLGANLGDPPAQLRAALDRIAGLGTLVAVSPFYRSPPMGPTDQPDYCNAVCVLDTTLVPPVLMQALLGVERSLGRERGVKWGPRTIDLDLLHVDGQRCATPDLQLPHPGIGSRAFVLRPLMDVAPRLEVPGLGPVSDALARIDAPDLERW